MPRPNRRKAAGQKGKGETARACAKGEQTVVDPGVFPAEEVGGESGQQRGLSGVAKGQSGIDGDHPPAAGKGEEDRERTQRGEENKIHPAAAQPVGECRSGEPSGGAAKAADCDCGEGLLFGETPLLSQFKDNGEKSSTQGAARATAEKIR